MADECTDVTTVEKLSIFCCWVEDGVPVEHILEIVPLKSADAKIIYFTLVEFLKEKNIQISNLVGIGFNGAATFSRRDKGILYYYCQYTCVHMPIINISCVSIC